MHSQENVCRFLPDKWISQNNLRVSWIKNRNKSQVSLGNHSDSFLSFKSNFLLAIVIDSFNFLQQFSKTGPFSTRTQVALSEPKSNQKISWLNQTSLFCCLLTRYHLRFFQQLSPQTLG